MPVDCIVINSQSPIDESLLIGESLRTAKIVGDTVLARSVNVTQALEVKTTQFGQHTVMSGMLALLETTQTCRPHLVTVADRISRWFLQALLLMTLIVGLSWYWVDASRAFTTVLAVLVVTCPCALSLAAP